MKSAYEIAMERIERESGPQRKLSEAQRLEIAEIEKRYDARIAEVKLNMERECAGAATLEEFQRLQAETASQIQTLEEKRGREKEAAWNS